MYSISYSIPYIFIFFFLYLFSLPLVSNLSRNTATIYIQNYSVFIVLLFFYGLRSYLLTDWIYYKTFFSDIPRINIYSNFVFKEIMENKYFANLGFLLLSIICKSIWNNYFFFQFVLFFLDLIILIHILKKYCNDFFVLALVFFFLFSGPLIVISLLRNSKSIFCFILSLPYLKNKKILQYLGWNFLGMLFHSTSIIFFPLYFFLNKKLNRRILLLLFFLGELIYVLQIKWLTSFLLLVLDVFGTKLTVLKLADAYLKTSLAGSFGISIGFIERSFTFLLCYFYSYKLVKNNEMNNVLVNCLYLYIFINLFCSEIFVFIQRVALLFIFSYWVIYPQIFHLLSRKKKYFFLIILLLYGSTKALLEHKSVINKYENVLGNYQTYEERIIKTKRLILSEKKLLH